MRLLRTDGLKEGLARRRLRIPALSLIIRLYSTSKRHQKLSFEGSSLAAIHRLFFSGKTLTFEVW